VLIVETTNFTENAIGVTNGLPSSTEKHLVERFALAADGQSLLYSFELTDPVYLAAPLRGEVTLAVSHQPRRRAGAVRSGGYAVVAR
jgi:hypothetical protein